MPRPLALVDATPMQSEHRLRGVGTYTRHLCEALARLAPDEVRFVAEARGLDLLPPAVRARAVTGFRPHQPAQLYWLANEWFLRRAAARVRPLVFHATDFNGVIRPAGGRLVATLYDLTWYKQRPQAAGLSARLSDLRWQVYYGQKLPSAHHLVAISESARQDAIGLLGIPAVGITTVPLGVDAARFQPGRGQGAYAGTSPYLLFVGSAEPQKNLARVLRAFAAVATTLHPTRLCIAGPWPTEAADALCAQSRALGIEPQVQVLGFVPAPDLASLYANALALVFPSLEEGFGLPVVEAMSCGTPVLTSDRGALAETSGGAALAVDPTDEAALAAAMARIATDDPLRESLAKSGQVRAKAFQWDTLAARTLNIYRQCAAGGLEASPAASAS